MTTDAVGGVWRYSIDLASTLADRGVHTTILGAGPRPRASQAAEAERLANVDLLWLDVPLDWTAKADEALAPWRAAIEGFACERNIDLVHVNAPALAAGLTVRCPLVVAAHSCLETWWRAVGDGPLPEDWSWRVQLNREGFNKADLVLAPSRTFARHLRQVYGPLERLSVVYNGAKVRVEPRPRRSVVFAAGRWWDRGKNLAVLDRAAAGCVWRVEIAGSLEGPEGSRSAEPRFAVAVGELDRGEMAESLSQAAIYLSIALYEPFGLSVLEAGAAGTALVLSDLETFRELWNGAALFVDPRDPDAIACVLNRLASNTEMRDSLGEAARLRASKYSLEAQRDGMLAAYAEACRTPHAVDAA